MNVFFIVVDSPGLFSYGRLFVDTTVGPIDDHDLVRCEKVMQGSYSGDERQAWCTDASIRQRRSNAPEFLISDGSTSRLPSVNTQGGQALTTSV
jgi:hypothetical protein